jgi:serine/threonine protein kinase
MLNSSGIVKVMDFGIAKAVGERGLTRTGTQVGTVYYMSPEQVKSEPVDSRSDIYALGITLYEMLSGRVPFLANSEFEVLTDHVKTAPPPPSNFLPSISKGIENIVLKAIAKDPKDRFQTAEEFGAALERPDEWTSFVVPTQNYGATRFETAEMNYSMPKESFAATLPLSPPPPPPPPPPTAMAPPAQRQTGLIAGLAAGGVCLAALIAFAAYRFWPGPTSSPAPAPTVTTQIAPVPTPSTQVDAAPPTIPLGAFDPKPTTSSPLPATPGRNDSAKPGNHPTASATSAKTSAAIADASAPPPPPPLPPMRTPDVTVPSGQEIVVRLTSAIDAATTQTGLVYSVTINAPISVNGRPAIPAGATAEIEVAHFEKPNRTKGGGKLDLSLKSITLAGHKYTVTSDRYELTGASRQEGR